MARLIKVNYTDMAAWVLAGLLLLPGSSVMGQSPNTTDELPDHPALVPFAESTVVEYSTENDANYRLVLGNMRQSGGLVVAEQSQLLRGDVIRITYEIPREFSGGDVFDFFLSQAESKGYRTLFNCTGRACGNSSYWANDVFGNRSLYGPERNQFYLALDVGNDWSAASHLVVYVTRRANRRLYAHVEIVEPVSGISGLGVSALQESLLEAGAVAIPGLSFDEVDALTDFQGIAQVYRVLEQNPNVSVYIVAHLRQPGNLQTLLSRSQERAERVRDALVEQGIAAGRIVPRGLGPLAPLCEGQACNERVELVLR